jgi:hypothetical protein
MKIFKLIGRMFSLRLGIFTNEFLTTGAVVYLVYLNLAKSPGWGCVACAVILSGYMISRALSKTNKKKKYSSFLTTEFLCLLGGHYISYRCFAELGAGTGFILTSIVLVQTAFNISRGITKCVKHKTVMI